jgi:plastocyanin
MAVGLAAAPAALAADTPTIAITANGNAFTGGLSFAPAMVQGQVGQLARWTDTDVIAPHTVTENHGLFDLVGNNVNGTPVSPSGFGPGTSVQLALPAGTISYFCRVHPKEMKGVIAVPTSLVLGPGYQAPAHSARTATGRRHRAARRRAFQRTLTITWAPAAPATGEAFDVEVRRGAGAWIPLATATTATSMRIKAGKRGTHTTVRSRLRRADDVTRATGWSPDASVTG